MITIRSRIAKSLSFTKRQQEIIVGSLLGDGHLVKTTCGYAFRVNHSIKQKEYVDWKYRELKIFTNSSPAVYEKENSYYFKCVSHSYFDEMRKKFYLDRKKILPNEIGKLLTPLALAVWIMDDGSKEGNQLRLNTQSFSLDENIRLIKILEATLGISATINRDKNRFRLRIRDQSMLLLKQNVLPHIISSMQYKFSL
ncbi:MAG: LAGLIDADG endonuclease [Candidatus Taylorbacteria bacterium]